MNIPAIPIGNFGVVLGESTSIQQIISETPQQNPVVGANIPVQSFLLAPGFGGGGSMISTTGADIYNDPQLDTQQNSSQDTEDSISSQADDSNSSDQGDDSEQTSVAADIVPPDIISPLAPIIVEPTDNKIFTIASNRYKCYTCDFQFIADSSIGRLPSPIQPFTG